jgi:hypothetical protein
LKYIDHLDLALAKIPTKVLNKLQVNVEQEIQSRACAEMTGLKTSKALNDTLKITLNKVQVEKEEVKQHMGQI